MSSESCKFQPPKSPLSWRLPARSPALRDEGRCLEIGYYVLSGIQLAAFGHIEEDAIPGLIDAEGFSLLIDMLYH